MDQQQNKIQDKKSSNDSSDYSLFSMVGLFYNRKMLSVIIIVWAYSLIFMALAIYSGIKFFDAEPLKEQLVYAIIFICSIQFIVLMKIFAWQMIHRNAIKKEIKKLQVCIADLTAKISEK